jgi:hypothetical protein
MKRDDKLMIMKGRSRLTTALSGVEGMKPFNGNVQMKINVKTSGRTKGGRYPYAPLFNF